MVNEMIDLTMKIQVFLEHPVRVVACCGTILILLGIIIYWAINKWRLEKELEERRALESDQENLVDPDQVNGK